MLPHDIYGATRSTIEHNRRIDRELARLLLRDGSLEELGALADLARSRRAGGKVYFIKNYHLYYTNICAWQCAFCAFSRHPRSSDGYSKTLCEIDAELDRIDPDTSEIRITGGVNPYLEPSFYLDMVSNIRRRRPAVQIEAFAATEIAFIAKKMKKPVEEVLLSLKERGLDSLTAGGAEIFNEKLRQRLCPRKPAPATWIEVTRTAHRLGIASNASILFGHLEDHEDWLEHLFTLRGLQDETGGFNSFIPLLFLPQNTLLDHLAPAGFEEALKMMAISRLVLDNFKYLKFLWIYYGTEQIERALRFGVNDLAGTVYEKHKGVARSAGSKSPSFQSKEKLIEIIKKCGRTPVERGRFYEERHAWY